MAGAVAPIATGCCATPFAELTCTVAWPTAVAAGTCAFTWNGVAAITGALWPLTSTVAPASPAPKIEMNPPGAIDEVKLAAFTTVFTALASAAIDQVESECD